MLNFKKAGIFSRGSGQEDACEQEDQSGGVLAVWGYMALAWLRLRRRLATAVWRGSAQMGWWWESDRIPTAFVFGFFTPRVYVPAGLEGETLRWVLLHERAHIKLGHHRYKAV